MDIQLANNIKRVAIEHHIDVPLIVGGYVRDSILGLENQIQDIDLTTNNPDVLRLAVQFAHNNNFYYKIFNDLHITIYSDKYKNLDFSSNFNSKLAIEFFKNKNFSEKKYYEIISRDFTINTLHMSMFNNKIIDPLNVGQKDCDLRLIRATSSPEICLKDDPRRAYRAVSIASKLNFKIDGSMVDYIRANHSNFVPEKVGAISEPYITANIDKVIGINDDVLLGYLIDTGLLSCVPLIGKYKDLLIKNNMISIYLDSIK